MWFALLLRRIATLPWRALKALGRGVRAAWRGLRAPAGRLGVQVALTVAALAGALAAGWLVVPGAGPAWSFGAEPSPEPEEAPLVEAPEDAPAPGLPADPAAGDEWPAPEDGTATEPADGAAEAPADLASWAQGLRTLGIPERALTAYGLAELVAAVEHPGCNLSWTTLAGIGAVETNHGTTGGNRIQADGTTLTPIRGAEYGEFGPMQFLGTTWEDWKADGDKDGVYNPDDIDDAVAAAADYLCQNGHDLADPQGWYDAVHLYNPSDDYVQRVFDRADRYGRQSTA